MIALNSAVFINGLTIGAIYALSALGLTMVYGLLRILHIAHAGVYVMGAYVGLWIYLATHDVALTLLAAGVGAGVLGILIERFLYEPLLDQPPLIPLIASIGLFTGLADLFQLIAGPYRLAMNMKLPVPALSRGAIYVSSSQLTILVMTVVLLAAVWYVTERTGLGLGWRALADDTEIAAALGVNTRRMVAANFLIGSAIAGIAGVLVGMNYNAVYPTMGNVLAYKGLAIVVLGGLGSVSGTIVAALLLGITESYALTFLGNVLPPDSLAFIALVIVLLLRPEGILRRR